MRCLVAYATADRQRLWAVELPAGATVAEALAAARAQSGPQDRDVPWDEAPVGVFGVRRRREAPCAEGERIELYRPLERDPRERRREQVARARRGAR
ncbi:MAG TPA: RnfH family protein [Steroidobacteraceae bacterium]|nr:RnfH family protein [Steroidobacteraceae bacterium]